MHEYTEEQIEYLREISWGKIDEQITKMFNERFGLNLRETVIRSTRKRYKIKVGYKPNRGQFKKGSVPWNKGLEGVVKPTHTWEKGHTFNCKPIGTERTMAGYTEVKFENPNTWRPKHQVIYEQHYGEIPEGNIVIFGDGDKTNFDIDNLVCVSRRQLLTMNSNNLIMNNADLTRTGAMIADLKHKITDRGKGKR